MSKLLKEASAPLAKTGKRWRAVLITPGEGSTGIYAEEALRTSGPIAFPKGTHSYVDHPRSETESRSPKNLMGVLAEDAYYEDGVGLVAEMDVFPHWAEFVDSVGPHTGLSVWAMAEGEEVRDGKLVVEQFTPDIMNSVDLVSYPGRAGSGLAEKLYESALRAQDSDSGADPAKSATVHTKEEGYSEMELKDLDAKLDLFMETMTNKFTAIEEGLKAPVEESEEETVEAVAEALVAAGLPEASRKAVYKAHEAGVPIADAIAEQAEIVESVRKSVTESLEAEQKEKTAVVIGEQKTAKSSLAETLNVKVGE